MRNDFKYVEIVDLNLDMSGYSHENNMMYLCFDLSIEAPRDWRKQFLQEWSKIRRQLYRNAVAFRNHVCIECHEEEARNIFDRLKEAVNNTNQRYEKYLHERDRQGQPEKEKKRLEKLRHIRSTLGFE